MVQQSVAYPWGFDRLAEVVGEIGELSFTASRRIQLAVEQSRVNWKRK
jgi:hypothetical protein